MQLNSIQNFYVERVRELLGKENAQYWLEMPNTAFKNRPPIELLLSGNYDYFDQFIGEYSKVVERIK